MPIQPRQKMLLVASAAYPCTRRYAYRLGRSSGSRTTSAQLLIRICCTPYSLAGFSRHGFVCIGPRRPLYMIYAGLATELFSDTVALLRFHGRNQQNSRVFRVLQATNVISMLGLRVIPAISIITFLFTLPRNILTWLYILSVAFYCGYLLRLSFKQLSLWAISRSMEQACSLTNTGLQHSALQRRSEHGGLLRHRSLQQLHTAQRAGPNSKEGRGPDHVYCCRGNGGIGPPRCQDR